MLATKVATVLDLQAGVDDFEKYDMSLAIVLNSVGADRTMSCKRNRMTAPV
jgi:hypothetical protein